LFHTLQASTVKAIEEIPSLFLTSVNTSTPQWEKFGWQSKYSYTDNTSPLPSPSEMEREKNQRFAPRFATIPNFCMPRLSMIFISNGA